MRRGIVAGGAPEEYGEEPMEEMWRGIVAGRAWSRSVGDYYFCMRIGSVVLSSSRDLRIYRGAGVVSGGG